MRKGIPMTTALSPAPSMHDAVREYGRWRVGAGGYSLNTWAGEVPGLMAFADYCADVGVERFYQLSDGLLDDWWADTKGRLAEATAPVRLHQLRSFLHWAMTKKWLAEDPTVLIRAPKPAPEPRQRLTARELLDLIEVADYPQHRIILALAANLAVRQSEIVSLLIRDVDLDAMSIRVHVHKTKKTPPDDMPLTAELADELRRWLAHYRAACPGLTSGMHLVPSQYVSPQGTVVYRPDRSIGDPEDVVKRALTRLGWDDVKGQGIHTVRASMARIFFDAVLEEEGDGKFDEALLGCMRLLHHDRPETTLRYIGVDRQTLARDKFLRGRPFLTRVAGAPKLAIAK